MKVTILVFVLSKWAITKSAITKSASYYNVFYLPWILYTLAYKLDKFSSRLITNAMFEKKLSLNSSQLERYEIRAQHCYLTATYHIMELVNYMNAIEI